jgi:cell wall-associated NlpC family hydrolase
MPKPNHVLRGILFLLALHTPTGFGAAEDPRNPDIPVHRANLILNKALAIQHTKMDCTHLVHYLYQQSGLGYPYADSTKLYQGVKDFRRVVRPRAGDVIVWPGHAGIVVDPEEHTFVSALRTGVKVSSYISDYWRNRGRPRFLRYVGNGMIESSFVD